MCGQSGAGNWPLYLDILKESCTLYGGIAAELEAMVSSGNLKDACRSAHALKGAAGNISAKPLQTTAMALEYDKGSFTLAVALGMVLLGLSFGMNVLFHFFQGQPGGVVSLPKVGGLRSLSLRLCGLWTLTGEEDALVMYVV